MTTKTNEISEIKWKQELLNKVIDELKEEHSGNLQELAADPKFKSVLAQVVLLQTVLNNIVTMISGQTTTDVDKLVEERKKKIRELNQETAHVLAVT